jgi:hypothetical protein
MPNMLNRMMSFAFKSILLSAVMLNVVMLNVVILNVVMLSVLALFFVTVLEFKSSLELKESKCHLVKDCDQGPVL